VPRCRAGAHRARARLAPSWIGFTQTNTPSRASSWSRTSSTASSEYTTGSATTPSSSNAREGVGEHLRAGPTSGGAERSPRKSKTDAFRLFGHGIPRLANGAGFRECPGEHDVRLSDLEAPQGGKSDDRDDRGRDVDNDLADEHDGGTGNRAGGRGGGALDECLDLRVGAVSHEPAARDYDTEIDR